MQDMTLYSITHGQCFDIPDGIKLSWSKSNILFAFDDAKCERSTSFSLPCTPHNNRMFANSKSPNNNGSGMRIKYKVQVQDGMVVQDGDLYVSEATDNAYKCVLVVGDLVGLQAIRDAGKVANLVTANDYLTLSANGVSPQSRLTTLYAQVNYATEGVIVPSIRLQGLIADVCTRIGVPVPTLPDATIYSRIIPPTAASLKETAEQVSRTYVAEPTTQGVLVSGLGVDVVQELFTTTANRIAAIQTITDVSTEPVSRTDIGYVTHLKTKNDLRMTFPDDFPSNIFIGYFATTPQPSGFTFLANYSFSQDAAKTVTGEPLAGRDVELLAGTEFVFVRLDEYVNEADTVQDTERYGWHMSGEIVQDVTLQGLEDSVPVGQIVRLQDNLPDMTLLDLLKAAAAISGCVLSYEGGAVIFDKVNTETWDKYNVDVKLISLSTVKRTFNDYAQHNLVQFDSGDRVGERERLRLDYDIDNVNLDAQKVLQTLPFSEGVSVGEYEGRQTLRVRGDDKWTVADGYTFGDLLLRVRLPEVYGVRSLTDRSTQVNVRLWLSRLEYSMVTPRTLIELRGVIYVWTAANWSDGVADMTLAAVSEIQGLGLPTLWLPFSENKSLAGRITELPRNNDNSFYGTDVGLDIIEAGGYTCARVSRLVVTGTRGINLTQWSIPYYIFATPHSVGGYTINAGSISVALWLRVNSADINEYGINLSLERNGMVFGTPDAYEFFGLIFQTGIGGGGVTIGFGCRNSSGNHVDNLRKLTLDTWTHFCFVANLDDMSVTSYVDGVQVARSIHGAFINWMWALQAPGWRMFGDYPAIRLPFCYRDVRIYEGVLTARQVQEIYQA